MQPQAKEHPVVAWDTYQIAKDQADYLIEEGEHTDEGKAFEDAFSDIDLYTWQWEALTEILTEWLNKLSDNQFWIVTGEGLGWRHLSGHKTVNAIDGQTLLREILPDTENSFTITQHNDYLRIVNSHHDAQGEVYIVRREPSPDDAPLKGELNRARVWLAANPDSDAYDCACALDIYLSGDAEVPEWLTDLEAELEAK